MYLSTHVLIPGFLSKKHTTTQNVVHPRPPHQSSQQRTKPAPHEAKPPWKRPDRLTKRMSPVDFPVHCFFFNRRYHSEVHPPERYSLHHIYHHTYVAISPSPATLRRSAACTFVADTRACTRFPFTTLDASPFARIPRALHHDTVGTLATKSTVGARVQARSFRPACVHPHHLGFPLGGRATEPLAREGVRQRLCNFRQNRLYLKVARRTWTSDRVLLKAGGEAIDKAVGNAGGTKGAAYFYTQYSYPAVLMACFSCRGLPPGTLFTVFMPKKSISCSITPINPGQSQCYTSPT